ncbi:response regulator transcription factor [Enterococcus sp. LJL99]
MKKIYIVEDESQITASLSTYLKRWEFDVCVTSNFQRVTEEVNTYQPDLILLDISLPFYNGFYWCKEIREQSNVPIVFLSSASDKMNIVMAMNMGADDFIAKPFDLEILVAKITAILRRGVQDSSSNYSQYDIFILDLNKIEVKNETESIPLTVNEMKILNLLFQQPEKLVSKEQIMEKLWESENFIDANTLAVNIARLRRKVANIGLDQYILTKKGKGYLLSKGE